MDNFFYTPPASAGYLLVLKSKYFLHGLAAMALEGQFHLALAIYAAVLIVSRVASESQFVPGVGPGLQGEGA